MSNLLNAFYNSQNQIIDVTKECTFEWYQEPASCYAFLEVSGASGDFTDGETVTGGTSNATATVFSSYVDGGRVYVENVSGTFQAGETITGSSSNQTATVDGFVPERSWTSTPNNITQGIFPDSIISKDLDDYLEWESTGEGSGYIASLQIKVLETGLYIFPHLFGSGKDVNGITTKRRLYSGAVLDGLSFFTGDIVSWLNRYNGGEECFMRNGIFYIKKTGNVSFSLYQADKGTFRWRIHNIRVLKLVI